MAGAKRPATLNLPFSPLHPSVFIHASHSPLHSKIAQRRAGGPQSSLIIHHSPFTPHPLFSYSQFTIHYSPHF
jgi:hypothetical protein